MRFEEQNDGGQEDHRGMGATGAQGGGLVRAILADPAGGFAARAITRDVTTDKARALAQLGAEVVQANVDDEASVTRAFEGAYGAYCVTFFWDHYSPEKEIAEARTMAAAAKAAGVQHVIWSTLEDTRLFVPLSDNRMPTLKDRYKVPHFDGKGESNKFFTEAGVPTTFMLASFYWDNLIYFGAGPKKGPDGVLGIHAADRRRKDGRHCRRGHRQRVRTASSRRAKAEIGKTIGIAGEHLTGAEMAAALTKALGQDVRYNAVTPETYRSFGFPGADDLGEHVPVLPRFRWPGERPARRWPGHGR